MVEREAIVGERGGEKVRERIRRGWRRRKRLERERGSGRLWKEIRGEEKEWRIQNLVEKD